MSRARGEKGAVTAELAMAMPLLVALTMALAWLLSLAHGQILVVDAAREAARFAARGEDDARAHELAGRIAPRGARVSLAREGEWVVVSVQARVAPLRGVLGGLGAVTLSSEATAAVEPDSG